MIRKRYLGAGAAVIALSGGGGLLALGGSGNSTTARPAPPATADITRGDLIDTTSMDGTLTFAGERPLTATAGGTVTSLPAVGRVIEQGRPFYQIDRKPLVLMYGTLPLFRTLEQGIGDGPDIRQLERGLNALGYGDDLTVDGHFSSATAQAVREWQKDRGLERTGAVDAAQVIFLPAKVRVTAVKITLGDRIRAGQQALTVTSTRRIVHVDLDAGKQDLVRKGAEVSVEMPGGATAQGEITSVGTVAKQKKSDASSGQDKEATIDVEIVLTGTQKKTWRLDQAPVTVTLESERRKQVLSVPIEALLALRGGGFGVEVAEPGRPPRLVTVRTGVYGGGRVEITGPGLAAGQKVGVPAQ